MRRSRGYALVFGGGLLLAGSPGMAAEPDAESAAQPTAEPAEPAAAVDEAEPQDELNPDPGAEPETLAPPRPELEAGRPLGEFRLYPGLTVSGLYDDNIFATRDDPIDDWITIISPSVALRSQWDRHKVNLSAGADIARYSDNDSEDYEDTWITGSGRYDITPGKTSLFGGASYTEEHEERGSPDDVSGLEPTTYSTLGAHLGAQHTFDKLWTRFGVSYRELDFDDVATSTALINMDDRDRALTSVGARIGYPVAKRTDVFVQVAAEDRRYDDTFDDFGFQRDSEGTRAAIGLRMRPSPRLTAEVFAGNMWQNYADARFEDVSELDVGANVEYAADRNTDFTAYLDRSIEETTLIGSSGYLSTRGGLEFAHAARPRVTVTTRVAGNHNAYQDVARTDDLVIGTAGLRYDLSRYFYLGADYRFLHRSSDVPSSTFAAAFYRNQYMLTLGAHLGPAQTNGGGAADDTPATPRPSPGGFYIGAQTGYGTLATDSGGSRGTTGAEQGDFGAMDSTHGLFAGYGWLWRDRWYVGVEAEAQTSDFEWDHVKDKAQSRTFDLAKKQSHGISGRLGYALSNGALLYTRLGLVETEFDSFYQQNNNPGQAADDSDEYTGTQFGVGAELPASARVFWRLGYTVTDYEDYELAYGGTQPETWDHEETQFRLGLGWRFNGEPKGIAQRALRPGAYDGLYAGVQVGYGGIADRVKGTHNDGGPGGGGPFDYDVDFADNGPSSAVFVGYGFAFNRLYLSAELEAEGSRTEWTHDRATLGGGGRNFSVQKLGGRGASVRVGYILPGRSLIYARYGRMRTEFNTLYAKGANRANDIDRDDTQSGDRFGVGAEVPLTERLFIRMDYSYTEYDSYGFTTEHANQDSLTYEPTESLFKLGIGMRL